MQLKHCEPLISHKFRALNVIIRVRSQHGAKFAVNRYIYSFVLNRRATSRICGIYLIRPLLDNKRQRDDVMSIEFSIVTIVKRRTQQLSNLVSSIERSQQCPKEMVIVWMTPPSDESLLSSEHFPILHRFAASETFPIAKARNRGFDTCTTDKFIYLDADCICPDTLLGAMASSLTAGKLVTANVNQLSHTVDDVTESLLKQLVTSQQGTAEKIPFIEFDTTIFGVTREDYDRVGGFDLDYCGYGLGDLDFAARCSQAELYLLNTGRYVYKHFHAHYHPPVNHLCDIVTNAETFKQKWGTYPTCKVFAQFAELGLINSDYEQTGMRITHLLDEDEMAKFFVEAPVKRSQSGAVSLQQTA